MPTPHIALFCCALLVYCVMIPGIGMVMARRAGRCSFSDFVTAGSRQAAPWVAFSLMATMLGSSNTFGSMELYRRLGFPAIWWMGVGVIGLVLQALLLSGHIRNLHARTLPHAARLLLGERAGTLIGVCIALAWVGVVAAQFAALGSLLSVLVPLPGLWLCLLALAVILHTAVGGQSGVIRADAMQCLLIGSGFVSAALFLMRSGSISGEIWLTQAVLFNPLFGVSDFVRLLLLVGGAYFLGPDLFSRSLAARDGGTARRAAFGAAAMLGILALFMSLIGVWAGSGACGPESPLATLIVQAPAPVALMLAAGLIAALVSSADTALLSDAAIIENDIIGGGSLSRIRGLVIGIGILALGMALWKKNIIDLFLAAYGLYVPSTVVPLAVAIMTHGRRAPDKRLSLAAVLAGGCCGLAGLLLSNPWMPVAGVAASALCMAAACLFGECVRKDTGERLDVMDDQAS